MKLILQNYRNIHFLDITNEPFRNLKVEFKENIWLIFEYFTILESVKKGR